MSDDGYLETPRNPGKDDGKCANYEHCGHSGLDEHDHRCNGCGYLICGVCDTSAPLGMHFVVDHWAEEEW